MFKSINGGILPKRSTKNSAGFDVFANEDAVIGVGETKLIGLGIAIYLEVLQENNCFLRAEFGLDDGNNREVDFVFDEECFDNFLNTYYFELHIRSSLRVKGLTSLGTGIIDIDFVYPNEIKMVINNPYTNQKVAVPDIDRYGNAFGCHYENPKPFKISKGDKIGQLMFKRHEGYLMPQEYTIDEERMSGFGSTGK